MEIDLGGIAKGWIAGRALQVLAEYAQTCAVNAGGDIVFQGVPDRQSGWLIALEDPRDTSQILAMLKVGPGAVATSSITKRSWIQAGKLQHHLIDPRNSHPAITQWLSVTVIAAQTPRGEQGTITPVSTPAVASEVFAKVLLITGLEETFDIAPWERNFSPESGEFAFIAVDRAGKLWGSPNSMEYLDVHTNNL
jgi:thiamine biosynthesis lipoprotein ApbE